MAKATPTTSDMFADLREEEETKKAVASITAEFGSVDKVAEVSLFASLSEGAAETEGHDLIQKEALVGIPFLITAIVFRDGVMRKAAQNNKLVDVPTNYVSLECVVGDRFALQAAVTRNPKLLERIKAVEPNERIVINDGSTGICRQAVSYLEHHQAIALPDGPIDGAAGESRYDTYRADWVRSVVPLVDAQGAPLAAARFELGQDNPAPVLLVKRGLRVSEYENNGQPAGTFYLA